MNEAFARRFLKGASPLGHTLTLPTVITAPGRNAFRIVGVVADAVYVNLREVPHARVYLPLGQHDEPFFIRTLESVNLDVRASGGSPAQLTKSVVAAIGGVDPHLTVTVRPLADQIDDSLARERVLATLAGFFAVLALLLAAIGLFGVTAYAVSRRRTEIGIRMALGAAPSGIVRLVMSRVLLLVGAGVIAGTVASLWASRFVATLLFGLEPRDPATLIGAALTLATVAALAAGWPAWRASRIDPAVVLRNE